MSIPSQWLSLLLSLDESGINLFIVESEKVFHRSIDTQLLFLMYGKVYTLGIIYGTNSVMEQNDSKAIPIVVFCTF